MDNLAIEFKPDPLIAVRVYNASNDETVALLELETALEWDNSIACLLAWLKGVGSAYIYSQINAETQKRGADSEDTP